MYHFVLAACICGLFATSEGLPPISANNTGHGRIVGGVNTTMGEIPYQLLLRRRNTQVCGAALVLIKGQQVVLTAAHCVIDVTSDQYTVVAGSYDTRVVNSLEQTRQVSAIAIHENYNRATFANDIAILSIESPFQLNRNVAAIRLPTQGKPTTGDVVISGWGRTSDGGPTSPILQKVQVPIIDHDACVRAYAPLNVSPSTICAGVLGLGGKDACQGDSGGPVVAANGGYLAGLVSWGTGCAHPNFPGVNTEVSHFISWLNSKVQLSDEVREQTIQQLIAQLFALLYPS